MCPESLIKYYEKGFTLAELLIALAILGVIATFTIPKVMNSQQNGANAAKAKEAAAMITGAHQQAQLAGVVNSNTKAVDLTPYMNYVSYDTSGTVIDGTVGIASSTCSAATPCIKLHNGGVLWFWQAYFDGTSSTNVVEFRFDPDGSNNTTSTANGPLKAVQFDLYYNGFLTTRYFVKAGTCSSETCFGPGSYPDPVWFSW